MKINKLICVVITVCIAFCVCSCSDNSLTDETIIAQVTDSLATLDPQLAQTTAEMTAVINCFDGLVRLDENGVIVNGAAEQYTVSEDKLTYTFTLRENMLWSDETTPVTADDFVYGLQRALAPETKAPYASLLYSIKNAEAVQSGKMNRSKLGVTAVDSKTVKIVLARTDYNLLSSLSRPVAMPCNKAFFEQTDGKYGLDRKNIICNGSFYLSKWNTEDDYVKFTRFEQYNGDNKSMPAAVSLAFNKPEDLISTNLENDSIDLGSLSAIKSAALSQQGFNSSVFYNTSYVLYLSSKLSENTRKALFYDLNKATVDLNLPDYYKTDCSIVPLSSVEGQSNYRTLTDVLNAPKYDKSAAKKLYTPSDDDPKTLYYPSDNEDIKLAAGLIAQNWQRELDAYINISEFEADEAYAKLKSGEIIMAIIPVTGFGGTALDSLMNFKGLKLGNFDHRLESGNADVESFCNYMKSGEQYLVTQCYVYPLFNLPTTYSESKSLTHTCYSSSGKYIDFKYTIKAS